VYDAVNGYHSSFRMGMCSPRAQCECRGTRSQDQCIALYVAEGPSGGHYQIISSSRYTQVACGVAGNFYTHNFY
jgi:hypothetical protein